MRGFDFTSSRQIKGGNLFMLTLEKHQLIREAIREMTLFDDIFFRAVFDGRIKESELLLRIILKRDDITVLEAKTQYDISNIYGKSSRLDLVVEDAEGHLFDVEIQKTDDKELEKRLRYYSGLLDQNSLPAGGDHKDLKDNYIICITRKDVFKKGLSLYHVERVIMELKDLYNDGIHIIYVNGSTSQEDAISDLMHDFRCADPDEMINEELSEMVRDYKESKEGYSRMGRIFDEWTEAVRAEGMDTGKGEGKAEIICSLLNSGMSAQEISQRTKVPLETINELAKNLSI